MIEVKVFGTPVRLKAVVLGNLVVLWALAAWIGITRHQGRSVWMGVLVGFAVMILLLVADFGHAIAHILSARAAGGPMEQVLIAAGMPRTLYPDAAVPPQVHRLRATGGPIFSMICLLLSLVVYALSGEGSLLKELAGWSAIGHAFIGIGSLLPLPVVDGGSILKWTLVLQGKTEPQADEILRRVDWGLGITGLALGVGLLAAGLWIPGVIAAGVGVVALGTAIGLVR